MAGPFEAAAIQSLEELVSLMHVCMILSVVHIGTAEWGTIRPIVYSSQSRKPQPHVSLHISDVRQMIAAEALAVCLAEGLGLNDLSRSWTVAK